MKPSPPEPELPHDDTRVPFPKPWLGWPAKFAAFHWRDYWWHLLDRWEARRSFRWWLYGLLALLVLLAGLGLWGYPRWAEHNAIRLARQWLASGHYKYAVEAVEEAMLVAPRSPEPWQIAADLARLGGQFDRAMEYARRAAQLGPENTDLQIAWAAAALRADRPEEAEQALRPLAPEVLAMSAPAQRLLGEIDRRRERLTPAMNHFDNALRLDGPGAIDEIPLGLILLNATDPVERRRGLVLLTKWTTDPEWGATALRTLLQDALARNEPAAVLKWAEALRVHPGCTLGDMPTCLLALAQTDRVRYAAVLAAMEKDHAVDPKAAAQLLSWLNQIGRSADAVRWMQTLPPAGMRRPPLVVAAAEALRQTADWPALRDWTLGKNWGPEAEFMRWAYGLQAARMLGETAVAEELWLTLYNHAQVNGVHALFAAATIYSWGRVTEAEALWWRAAAQEGKIATEALGSLARHYQVRRDAEGQYRVFRQLHLLQPGNAAVGNNFAFFAALTGREQRQAERIARANLEMAPSNRDYLATLSFVLLMQQQVTEALTLLQPHEAEIEKSPALRFAYGLILASHGRKAEAHRWLDGLPPESLTLREVELIQTALAN